MEIRPIKTDADHDAALREIERLWRAPEGSEEGDRLEVLVTLVEAYERTRFPNRMIDSFHLPPTNSCSSGLVA